MPLKLSALSSSPTALLPLLTHSASTLYCLSLSLLYLLSHVSFFPLLLGEEMGKLREPSLLPSQSSLLLLCLFIYKCVFLGFLLLCFSLSFLYSSPSHLHLQFFTPEYFMLPSLLLLATSSVGESVAGGFAHTFPRVTHQKPE